MYMFVQNNFVNNWMVSMKENSCSNILADRYVPRNVLRGSKESV